MKNITVLGSTGSIGRSTLDVISRNRESFRVVALTAGSNIRLLESQIREFKPKVVAVADAKTAGELAKKVRKIDILSGPDGISQVAAYPGSDFVISSIV